MTATPTVEPSAEQRAQERIRGVLDKQNDAAADLTVKIFMAGDMHDLDTGLGTTLRIEKLIRAALSASGGGGLEQELVAACILGLNALDGGHLPGNTKLGDDAYNALQAAIDRASGIDAVSRGALSRSPDGWRAITKPLAEWHEDIGPVLWWKFPIDEAPYVGTPLDLGQTVRLDLHGYVSMKDVGGWPGYHTHWTPIPLPEPPSKNEQA